MKTRQQYAEEYALAQSQQGRSGFNYLFAKQDFLAGWDTAMRVALEILK